MHETEVERARERADALRRELREEVVAEVQSNMRARTWRRMFLRWGGCCSVYLIGTLAFPILFAYLTARTGVVPVPFFGSRVAHTRAPTRVVTPAAVPAFDVLLASKLRAAARSGAPSVVVTFTEAEITGVLRTALGTASGILANVRTGAQVVIERGSVEIFTRVRGIGGAESTLLVVGTPELTDGKWGIRVHAVTMGTLRIPRVVVQRFADAFLRDGGLPATISEGAQGMTIERIDLESGSVTVTVRPTVPSGRSS